MTAQGGHFEPGRDLPYVAALLDAFATLRIRELTNATELPEVTVQHSRVAALDWLAEVTGVRLTTIPKDYTRHQCSEHCPDRHTRIESSTRRWQVTGARATIVLAAVEPFMRVHGITARNLVRAGQAAGYKTNVVNDMAVLGWPVPDLRDQPRARYALAGTR